MQAGSNFVETRRKEHEYLALFHAHKNLIVGGHGVVEKPVNAKGECGRKQPRRSMTIKEAAEISNKSLMNFFPSFDTLGDVNYFQEHELSVEEWLQYCLYKLPEKRRRVPQPILDLENNSDRQDDMPSFFSPSDAGRELSPGYFLHPVTQENLADAQDLLLEIFPDDVAHFEVVFSVLKKPFIEYEFDSDIENSPTVAKSFFWLIVEKATGSPAAICSLMYRDEDYEDSLWGSWYGVGPTFRRKGLGSLVLLFLLEKSVLSRKRTAKFFTEELDFEEQANSLYDYVGAKVYKRQYFPKGKCHRIWRQAQVGGSLKNLFVGLLLINILRFLHRCRCLLWELSDLASLQQDSKRSVICAPAKTTKGDKLLGWLIVLLPLSFVTESVRRFAARFPSIVQQTVVSIVNPFEPSQSEVVEVPPINSQANSLEKGD